MQFHRHSWLYGTAPITHILLCRRNCELRWAL